MALVQSVVLTPRVLAVDLALVFFLVSFLLSFPQPELTARSGGVLSSFLVTPSPEGSAT